MSYNFHIGQEIVCIDSKSNKKLGSLKEGEVYTIKGLCISNCSCKIVLINIGIISQTKRMICDCGNLAIECKYHWYNEKRFTPLDSLTNIDELTEILEQPLFEVK